MAKKRAPRNKQTENEKAETASITNETASNSSSNNEVQAEYNIGERLYRWLLHINLELRIIHIHNFIFLKVKRIWCFIMVSDQ